MLNHEGVTSKVKMNSQMRNADGLATNNTEMKIGERWVKLWSVSFRLQKETPFETHNITNEHSTARQKTHIAE